jgi:anti-anti-sigma regulatory factor
VAWGLAFGSIGHSVDAMSAGSTAILHPLARSRQRPRRASGASVPEREAVSSAVLMAIVNAGGIIDANHVGPFARELARAVDAGATRLLVDLSRAEEVTTAGMNALLAARQRLFEQRGQIAVVLPRGLRRRFEALQLGRRFLLAADRLQAAQLLGLAAASSPGAGVPAPRSRAA